MADADSDLKRTKVQTATEELVICDAHMHVWDQLETVSKFNNHILGDCGTYLPQDYRKDLQCPKLRACVHVEAFPTNLVEETRWVDSLKSSEFPLGAIVANANISLQKEGPNSRSMQEEGMDALVDVLKRHKETSTLVRGIRWVLNYEPNWPQVYRNDYFTDPQFRAGYEKLKEYGLSFDLQCNPHQLTDAAAFAKDFPDVPVNLNHIGSLKLEGDDQERERRMNLWREGMKSLAALPHVHCKLSMFAYTLPNWWETDEGKTSIKGIVHEVIDMFGASRCMFASNFPAEDAPCRAELYANFKAMVSDLPTDVQEGLFFRNAERFYRIEFTDPA